jgi:hypothetical protein
MYTENSDVYLGFGGLGNRQADFDLLPLTVVNEKGPSA